MKKKNKDKIIIKSKHTQNKSSYKFDIKINQNYMLQTLINNFPDHIYIKDKNSRFLIVNKAKANFMDKEPQDLIGKTDLDFFPQQRSDEYLKDEKHVMKTGKPIIDKVEIALYKGKEFWMSSSKIPWYDENGNIMGTMGISRDITVRKHSTDGLLKDSEDFNRNILENSISPIYVMDIDKSMKYINPAFEKLTGFSSKEIIGGKPPRPYWIKGMESIYDQNIKTALKKGIKNFELPFIDKNGQKFWVEVSLIPIQGADGKIKFMLGSFVDITLRKKAYTKLEETLDNIINTLGSIVETRDPYTSGHQKRVTILSVEIAKKLKFSDEKIRFIKTASLLHDIGKMNIPPSILSKPARLSDIEFNIVKTHSQTGFDIIKKIHFQYPIEKVILQHHERENGSGYPGGLKGKDIMLEAKILGVADVVEAMSSHRPYRPSLGIKAAIIEIKNNKGILYDPDVVEACIKIIKSKKFSFDKDPFKTII